MSLRSGCALAIGPRALALLPHAGLPLLIPPALRPHLLAVALGDAIRCDTAEHLTAALGDMVRAEHGPLADPKLLRDLRELDRRFCGWRVGSQKGDDPRLYRLEEVHARRRVYSLPGAARPTLPASTLRRAEIIGTDSPRRIYLENDVDGLSLLLAEQAQVRVASCDPISRAWLTRERCRWQPAEELKIAGAFAPDFGADVAVVGARDPKATVAAMGRACRMIHNDGRVVLTYRAPYEAPVVDLVRAWDCEVLLYERDFDHWCLPGGAVVDGGGDLVVLKKPKVPIDSLPQNCHELHNAQPYWNFDLNNLCPDKVEAGGLQRVAQMLGAFSPEPTGYQRNAAAGSEETAWWFDTLGRGLTAHLWRQELHVMMTLMPYDVIREEVAMVAAYTGLGHPLTRSTSIRTRCWPEDIPDGRAE